MEGGGLKGNSLKERLESEKMLKTDQIMPVLEVLLEMMKVAIIVGKQQK